MASRKSRALAGIGWGLLVTLVFAGGFFLIAVVPQGLLALNGIGELPPKPTTADRAALLQADAAARQSTLLLLGGVLALVGVVLSYMRHLREVAASTREEQAAARESDRHWTSRYTDAVSQLGQADSPTRRLGGVFALERLANEASNIGDRQTVTSVLAGYVRETREEDERGTTAADLAACLEVLSRLNSRNRGELRIDLSGANLIAANLEGADLSGAPLAGANLSRANLARADLSGANLSNAQLTEAVLAGANLERCDLSFVVLAGMDLVSANLVGANLSGADLTDADLSDADLRGAVLTGTHLIGTYLVGAKLDPDQLKDAYVDDPNLDDVEDSAEFGP